MNDQRILVVCLSPVCIVGLVGRQEAGHIEGHVVRDGIACLQQQSFLVSARHTRR